VKETAANEIAAATAIMEIVFMFRLAETGCFPPEHARRMREHNLIKINPACPEQWDRTMRLLYVRLNDWPCPLRNETEPMTGGFFACFS
jgi:hypothetical protein